MSAFILARTSGIGVPARGAAVRSGIALLLVTGFVLWFLGARNPFTPAGYVGYLTKGAVFGKSRFYVFSGDRHRPGARGCST